jgi:tetratricopeptide (TPR) repeat protein
VRGLALAFALLLAACSTPAEDLGALTVSAREQARVAEASGDLEQIQRAGIDHLGLAMAYQDGGDVETSESLFGEAARLANIAGDAEVEATSLLLFGLIRVERRDDTEARRCFERALALYTDLGDEPGMANSHAHLGDLYARRGDAAAARTNLEQALALARKIRDAELEANVASALARLGSPAPPAE